MPSRIQRQRTKGWREAYETALEPQRWWMW